MTVICIKWLYPRIRTHIMCWMFLAHERHQLAFHDTKEMRSLLRAYIPVMMFHLGGHSFHEFVYPLTIPEVQAHFGFIEGFDTFTMENLFFTDNEDAFNHAREIKKLHLFSGGHFSAYIDVRGQLYFPIVIIIVVDQYTISH